MLDTEYAVRVRAVSGVGDGPASAEQTETAEAKTSEQQDSTPNTAATGAPTISGTAQVGETLNVDTSGIADEDGLDNVSFGYQWIRSDGATDSDIQDATGSTYTVHNDDAGKSIRVRVSFTDDDGNDESLTSDGLDIPRPPLTASFSGVPTSHSGDNTTFEFRLHFSVEPTLSYVNMRDDVLTVTNGSVDRVERVTPNGSTPDSDWKIFIEPDGDEDLTISISPTSNCNAASAVCSSDGRKLSNAVTTTVLGP